MEKTKRVVYAFDNNHIPYNVLIGNSANSIYDFHYSNKQRELNIPSMFLNAGVQHFEDKYRADLYSLIHEGKPFLLVGPPGTGKTYMMYATINYYLSTTILSLVSDADRVFANLPKDFPFFNGKKVAAVRAADLVDLDSKDYRDYDYLFIDDFGVNRSTEFANQKMDVFIDYRYSNQLKTWFTTNIGNVGADRVSERTMSRIRSMCKVVEVK